MFCKNCGKEIDDNAAVCIHCGVAQNQIQEVTDNGGFGWGLLGFCIPIVGLVLFLVWKDTKPKSSKSAGLGALISVGIGVLFYVLIFLIGLGGLAAGY